MPAIGERRLRSTSTASAFSGETYTTRQPRAGAWIRVSIDERNAASVLPDPVGAIRSVFSPFRMTGQACSCAGVGAGNAVRNHSRTAGWKASSTSLPMERGYRSADGDRPRHRWPIGALRYGAGRCGGRGRRPWLYDPLDAESRGPPIRALRTVARRERPEDGHLGRTVATVDGRRARRGRADGARPDERPFHPRRRLGQRAGCTHPQDARPRVSPSRIAGRCSNLPGRPGAADAAARRRALRRRGPQLVRAGADPLEPRARRGRRTRCRTRSAGRRHPSVHPRLRRSRRRGGPPRARQDDAELRDEPARRGSDEGVPRPLRANGLRPRARASRSRARAGRVPGRPRRRAVRRAAGARRLVGPARGRGRGIHRAHRGPRRRGRAGGRGDEQRRGVRATGDAELCARRMTDLDEFYDAYERIEPEFQAVLDQSLRPRGPDQLYDLVGELGLPPEARVLDLGCGDGRHAFALAERFGVAVLGIDPVDRHVEEARDAARRRPQVAGRVSFERGAAEAIPVPDASVDLVWCRDVLYHVAALEQAYAECRRVLRDRGRILVYQWVATERLEPNEAAWLWQTMGVVPANGDVARTERAIASARLRVER